MWGAYYVSFRMAIIICREISETSEKLTEQDVKGDALYVLIMDVEMERNTLMRQNPYWMAKW